MTQFLIYCKSFPIQQINPI